MALLTLEEGFTPYSPDTADDGGVERRKRSTGYSRACKVPCQLLKAEAVFHARNTSANAPDIWRLFKRRGEVISQRAIQVELLANGLNREPTRRKFVDKRKAELELVESEKRWEALLADGIKQDK